MKALRLALAALFLCQPALAAPTGKLIVSIPNIRDDQTTTQSARRFERMTQQVLGRVGVNYKTMDANEMKVQWGKTGVVGWGWGNVVADSCTFCEAFDAAMWINPNIGGVATSGAARMDSLLNSGRVYGGSGSGLAIPNLFLFSDYKVAASGQTMQATCCTTGVNNILGSDQYVYGLQRPVGSLNGWFTAGLFQRTMTRKNVTAAGGYRPLLVANQPSAYMNTASVDCGFCDSIPGANAATGEDSVIVFSLPFSNVNGSKPIIIAYADGNGGLSDSIALGQEDPALMGEVDPTVMLYALAALDSAAGGTLFDTDKLPIKLGLVIEAANVYGSNRAGPGIPPQDSAVLIATIDSLEALNARGGVKLRPTVAINVAGVSGAGDSLNGTGAYNRGWIDRWRSIGGTKFTPQPWAGVLSTAYRRANAGVGDVFGFADSRAFVGDFDQTTGTKDTTVAQQLKWAKRLMREAGIDPNEMSKTVVAPLLDWAPVNKHAVTDRDSALYAFRLAGFTTVISDANLDQSWPYNKGGTAMTSASYRGVSNGLMGYTATEGYYQDAGGGRMKVLASNGHDITGGTMQDVLDDSSNVAAYYGSIPLVNMYRIVAGLLTPDDNFNCDHLSAGTDFAATYFDDFKDQLVAHTLLYQNYSGGGDGRFQPRKGSIVRLTTADLSGCADCPRGAPARNGWWVIKSLKNWMDAVNTAAGRTVITFDYPENIEP